MAAHAPITGAPTRAPLPDIRALSINGTTPFLSGSDIRDDAIRGAHALLNMLSFAFEDAQALYRNQFTPGHDESIVEGCNSRIKADALQGIATLMALAQFGSDLASAEHVQRAAA